VNTLQKLFITGTDLSLHISQSFVENRKGYLKKSRLVVYNRRKYVDK
jgi:hypothetical protein